VREITAPLSAIVCGVPVVGQPRSLRLQLAADAAACLSPNGKLVQFSYSLRPPLPCPSSMRMRHAGTVWRNAPPMQI
jgi:phosphatidylethanolamine/phosphatidyl-N-methylethanolamine N-methyltransferase